MKGQVFFGVLVALVASLFFSCVVVPQSDVGVVTTFGKLENRILEPGLNFIYPFVSTAHLVQVTLQTDSVTDTPCGTSSGETIVFSKIEVVNQLDKEHVLDTVRQFGLDYDQTLIYDRIKSEMNQFCSKHTMHEVYITEFDKLDEQLAERLETSLKTRAPGLRIDSVRLTKPTVSADVTKKHHHIVAEQTEIISIQASSNRTDAELFAQSRKQIQSLEMENDLVIKHMVLEENKLTEQEHSKLRVEKTRLQNDHERKIQQIEIQKKEDEAQFAKELLQLERKKILIDKELEINTTIRQTTMKLENEERMLYYKSLSQLFDSSNSGYAQYKIAQSIASNSKMFYGSSLQQMFPLPLWNQLFHDPSFQTNTTPHRRIV